MSKRVTSDHIRHSREAAEAYSEESLRELAEGVAAPLEPSAPTRCSFCHKDSKQIDYIITSPIDYSPASICNECVNVCESILVERDGKKRSQAEPSTSVEHAFREWIQEGDNSKFRSASLDKKERYVKKFAEFYAAAVSKNLTDKYAEMEAKWMRELLTVSNEIGEARDRISQAEGMIGHYLLSGYLPRMSAEEAREWLKEIAALLDGRWNAALDKAARKVSRMEVIAGQPRATVEKAVVEIRKLKEITALREKP